MPLSMLGAKSLQHTRILVSASRPRAAAARAPSRHAQIGQAIEATQRGRDGAAQPVAIQLPATHTTPSLSITRPSRRPALPRGTHSFCKRARLPIVEGMVPLSWLLFKTLQ